MTRTLNALVAAAVLAFGALARRAERRAGDRVRQQRRSAEDAGRRLRRRSRRRRRQFEGPDLRLHAHRPSLRDARRQPHVLRTAARGCSSSITTGKFVRELGPGRLRLQRRDRPARRSAGQRLDDRRGGQPGREVRPEGRVALVLGRKPEAINVRPGAPPAAAEPAAAAAAAPAAAARRCAGGAGRPADAAAAARRDRARPGSTLQPSDRRRVGSRPATSTSPTASAPTTASRSSTRTAASSSSGDRPAPGTGQFNGVKALAVDAQGNVYVADAGNKRIQVFDARRHVQVAVRQRRHAARRCA